LPHNFSKDRSLVEDKPVPKPNDPLQDFEVWLKEQSGQGHDRDQWDELVRMGLKKLEELKEKYRVPN
jgi:hypothetical protein